MTIKSNQIILDIITKSIKNILENNPSVLVDDLKDRFIANNFQLLDEIESSEEKIIMLKSKNEVSDERFFIIKKNSNFAISKINTNSFEESDFEENFEIDLKKHKEIIIKESLETFQNSLLYKNNKEVTIWDDIYDYDNHHEITKQNEEYILNFCCKKFRLDLIIYNGFINNITDNEYNKINDLEAIKSFIILNTDAKFDLEYEIIKNIQEKSRLINNKVKYV